MWAVSAIPHADSGSTARMPAPSEPPVARRSGPLTGRSSAAVAGSQLPKYPPTRMACGGSAGPPAGASTSRMTVPSAISATPGARTAPVIVISAEPAAGRDPGRGGVGTAAAPNRNRLGQLAAKPLVAIVHAEVRLARADAFRSERDPVEHQVRRGGEQQQVLGAERFGFHPIPHHHGTAPAAGCSARISKHRLHLPRHREFRAAAAGQPGALNAVDEHALTTAPVAGRMHA